MSLQLRGQEFERCRSLSHALLSARDFDDIDQWCLAVLRHLEALFEAGLSSVSKTRLDRQALLAALDHCEQACAVRDIHGRELLRSARLAQMLDHEPERQRLLATADAMARSLMRLRWPTAKARTLRALPSPSRSIATAQATYTVRATFLPAGTMHRDEVALISFVRSARATTPSGAIVTFGIALGLTSREADVLRCRAEGHSYKTAAAELGISIDTVRTHIRHVHRKLGVANVTAAVARALGTLRAVE